MQFQDTIKIIVRDKFIARIKTEYAETLLQDCAAWYLYFWILLLDVQCKPTTLPDLFEPTKTFWR